MFFFVLSHNNALVVHFLCKQDLIFRLMRKEATRDESVNVKPVIKVWEGKQKSFANADLRRKLASETLHLFSYPEDTWIKT